MTGGQNEGKKREQGEARLGIVIKETFSEKEKFEICSAKIWKQNIPNRAKYKNNKDSEAGSILACSTVREKGEE